MPAASQEPGSSDDPLIGAVLADSYRVDRLLAEGGMARLYAGENLRLGSGVAIKVPHELRGGAQAVERAEREAQAMAGIASPYVARVLDLVRLPDGRPCLVTELLRGEDLSTRIARARRLEPVESARLARDVCLGLVEAHAKGILHRDIKPSNVFVTEEGQVKILDFGVAKVEGANHLTVGGAFVGTPAYISPEQAFESSSVDQRTDVYSLGAVLYHMLSGQPPYGNVESGETMMRLLSSDPPRLGSVAPVPEGLAAIVERAMSRDRGQRYGSAAALAEALSAYATATVDRSVERQARWLRPRALVTALFGTLCAGVVSAALANQVVRALEIPARSSDWRRVVLQLLPAVVTLLGGVALLRAVLVRWRSGPRVRALTAGLGQMIRTTAAAFGLVQITLAAAELFGRRTGLGEPVQVAVGLVGALIVGALSAVRLARSLRSP